MYIVHCIPPIAHIPGPWYSLWTDVVFKYYRMTGQGAIYVHRLHEKYGVYFNVTRSPWLRVIKVVAQVHR